MLYNLTKNDENLYTCKARNQIETWRETEISEMVNVFGELIFDFFQIYLLIFKDTQIQALLFIHFLFFYSFTDNLSVIILFLILFKFYSNVLKMF